MAGTAARRTARRTGKTRWWNVKMISCKGLRLRMGVVVRIPVKVLSLLRGVIVMGIFSVGAKLWTAEAATRRSSKGMKGLKGFIFRNFMIKSMFSVGTI